MVVRLTEPPNSRLVGASFGWSPLKHLNSGLLGYPKHIFRPELLEQLVTIVDRVTRDCYRAPQMQIFFALLFAAQPSKNVQRLPRSYVVSDTLAAYQDCRVGHYVRSVRERYFGDALKLMAQMQSEQDKT